MNETIPKVPADDGGPGCLLWGALFVIVIIVLILIF
jgi:hypothetical protein